MPVRPPSGARRLRRRDLLLAAGLLPPASAAARPAAAQPAAAPSRDALECAAALADLEFTEAERDLMRPDAARNRRRYAELRRVAIGPDTGPAFTFRPSPHASPPDRLPAGSATPHAAIPVARPRRVTAPADLEALAFEPVTTLSRLVERRLVTSAALTEMYLARLRRYGRRLNCVVTLTPEIARAQAAEADREIAAGRYRGPLHGIPWGAKDLFATRGVRTTWGAKPYENQVIDRDAAVVERLREAGAVLAAKLSMGALARGSVWFGGATRNPWDRSRSSSGSSAGPAAATAAGLVGFSVGTETLGSIISPSAACGAVGLRPTYGRVSRYGAMALAWTMDKVGPICRAADDCALVLNAVYGPDGRDASVVDAPFVWEPRFDPARLRVGYVAEEFERPPPGALLRGAREAEARLEVQRAALDDLRGAGLALEPVALPDFPAEALRLILHAEAAAAFDDLTRSGGAGRLTEQGPDAWPNLFRAARLIPAVEYLRAQRARTLLAREMEALLRRVDLFVSPPLSAGLTMTNFTGHPAIAFKAGFHDGLPVGLMMTGRLFDEATLLQAAGAYERATRWRTIHPPLDAP